MKFHGQKQLGEVRVYFVHMTISQSIMEEVRAQSQIGQETGGWS